MRKFPLSAFVIAILFVGGGIAHAGMASFTLADVPRVRTLADLARMRLEVISFFGLSFLIFAAMIQAIWNGMRRDFTRLPRLSYFRAVGIVALWGLLFLIVLTMISGARALMTPGAWEKVGATYRLAPEPPPIESEIAERYGAIARLRDRLFEAESQAAFPRRDEVQESLWVVPRTKDAKYLYLGGSTLPEFGETPDPPSPPQPRLLVIEPDVFGGDRLSIFRDGEIGWVGSGEVEKFSKPETRR